MLPSSQTGINQWRRKTICWPQCTVVAIKNCLNVARYHIRQVGPKVNMKVKKFHTYIAPLEVRGRLICRTLYITSPAGLLHPTLVWRFQEATNIPMQGGAWPVCPLMPWHYRYSFTPEWGEALSIWSKGVLNPSYLSFDSGQSRTRNLSHTSQELYHCATEARPEHEIQDLIKKWS